MRLAVDKLEALLRRGETFVGSVSDDFLRQPHAPGKWSRKQVVGHLIDSAINNLTRFTEIGYQPHRTFTVNTIRTNW